MKVVVSGQPDTVFDPYALPFGTLFEWFDEGTWKLYVRTKYRQIYATVLLAGDWLALPDSSSQFRPFTGTATISNEEASK